MNNSTQILSNAIIKRALVANKVLALADKMYIHDNFPNRVSAVILYLNLIEFYLGFLVRNISLKIKTEEFINKPLGEKIKKLEASDIHQKEELLIVLREINIHRVRIIHNIIDAINNKQMSNLIGLIKTLFDKFNGILLVIVRHYGIA